MKTSTIGARTPEPVITAIKNQAASKGLTVSELLNRWFVEKLAA